MNKLPIFIGKTIKKVSKSLNLGGGSTWPGHIALSLNENFIRDAFKKCNTKIILVAGTNGKTTTSKLVKTILEKSGHSVFLNQAGANLLNGIASAIISSANSFGQLSKDFAIFEVDENTLPLVIKQVTPDYIIALNLFRDQLDRYGEIDKIARAWKKSFDLLPETASLILNADDPLVSYLSENVLAKTYFFGLDDPKYETLAKQNAADSIYCLFCGNKLSYGKVFFSHLGDWYCEKCNHKRPVLNIKDFPQSSLKGTYNIYNVLAAVLATTSIGIKKNVIEEALSDFKAAFGRQEIIEINGKKIEIFLSKNPTSFNESLRTISDLNGKNLLLVLNDRIPDGRDVSWIWDTDIERLISGIKNITISGDRCYDMGLRVKYAQDDDNSIKLEIEENLNEAVNLALKKVTDNETLYILPTYSAMLEVRKILTGRKLL